MPGNELGAADVRRIGKTPRALCWRGYAGTRTGRAARQGERKAAVEAATTPGKGEAA